MNNITNLKLLKEVWSEVDQKKKLIFFLTLSLINALAEAVNIGLLIPFLKVIETPEILNDYSIYIIFKDLFSITTDPRIFITILFIFFLLLSAVFRIFIETDMIFFNQNHYQDRHFLELQTKINFSYWIAADLEHYFDSCEKDINQLEYKVLLKQYELALDIFNNVDIDASELSVEQKDCLEIHKEHTYKCITEELNFFDKKLTDSESEEINTFHQINQHNNFPTR